MKKHALFFAILAVLASSSVNADSTVITDSMTNNTYQAIYTDRNWIAARNDCVARGAHLAVITSELEYVVLQDVIYQDMTHDYFLGHRFPALAMTAVTVTSEDHVNLINEVTHVIGHNDEFARYYQYRPAERLSGLYWTPAPVTSYYVCEWESV